MLLSTQIDRESHKGSSARLKHFKARRRRQPPKKIKQNYGGKRKQVVKKLDDESFDGSSSPMF